MKLIIAVLTIIVKDGNYLNVQWEAAWDMWLQWNNLTYSMENMPLYQEDDILLWLQVCKLSIIISLCCKFSICRMG